MTPDDRSAGMHLLEKGTLVDFKILDVQVMPGPDDAEFGFRVDLRLGGDDDEHHPGHRRGASQQRRPEAGHGLMDRWLQLFHFTVCEGFDCILGIYPGLIED